MIASSRPRLTYEEYCQIEADSPIRHEYHDGQVWAMAGGSREHAAIAANIVGLLALALRGSACQVHTSDLRIRVRATGLATYPDVSVVCGRAELEPEDRLGHTVGCRGRARLQSPPLATPTGEPARATPPRADRTTAR